MSRLGRGPRSAPSHRTREAVLHEPAVLRNLALSPARAPLTNPGLPLHDPGFLDRGGVQLFRRDAASSYGWWGNIAVVVGRQSPDATHVVNYRACVVELHKRFPGGVGLITVVQAESIPSATGRAAMLQMFEDVWPMLEGVLFIPDAVGFKAAALRSVMGCVILAIGQRDRLKVDATLERGVPWLAAKMWGSAEFSRRAETLTQGVARFYSRESERG
jgi:hypothetical protein